MDWRVGITGLPIHPESDASAIAASNFPGPDFGELQTAEFGRMMTADELVI
jgi:hypothetical protein